MISPIASLTSQLGESLLFLVTILFVTAYFWASRAKLKRQLLLLQKITLLSNPHFGADRTIASVIASLMESLRSFYAADSCVLIMAEDASSDYRLRRVDCRGWHKALRGEVIPKESKWQLPGLLSPNAVLYRRGSHKGVHFGDSYHEIEILDSPAGEPAEGEASDQVATMLEAESFLAAPLFRHNRVAGRLYLTSQRYHAFRRSDVRLVDQVIKSVFPIIENIAQYKERTPTSFHVQMSLGTRYLEDKFKFCNLAIAEPP